ncbi:hypothetical protein chiPu_0000302 [Chiloscyllium punctatum]|uniref:Cadherin domain-containing protein n=1 Tax=Chiloscyllium punctatum TaxID=137246 RepID=A0A401RUT7_CHIPU|nr:hypothetical protein [Chiloscyllium punctatum]
MFVLDTWRQGTHCAPTISGVNPLSLNLQEDAKIHHLLTTITVALPVGDKLIGGPIIVNADPGQYPFDIIPNATNMWDLVTTNSPKLDFETTPRYTLQLLVKDEKDSSASQTIIINILDVNEPPVFLGPLGEKDVEVYIAENTAVNTPIYKVAAKDPDENDALTVEDTNALFIVGTVKVFITNVNDNTPVLSCIFKNRIKGKETDFGETSDTGQTAIIDLDEEIAVGTVIATCIAADADDMGDITYQLEPASNYFAVDKNTGSVMILSQMDRDSYRFQSVQTFTVKACDKNKMCADIPVRATILPINDNAPFCYPSVYRTTVPELLLRDTVVAVLICKDSDTPYDALTYVPQSGPLGPGMIFKQKTGADNVIQVGLKDLDYEDADVAAVGHTYQMTIAASDSTYTATATVFVEITPVNDFSPIFEKNPYIFDVLESTASKQKIGRVIATDDDYPVNAVTYKIISGDIQIIKLFWIDPKEGTIELITQSDYESVRQYDLTVEAIDSDPNQPKTAVTRVIINILEENDEKPVCIPLSYKASIPDNIAVGTNVNSFRLNCQDKDSLDNEMRFEIVSEPNEEKLEVVTEVTKYDTVFNGQAVDPVTGRWYEYNSKTGARKWKEANELQEANMNIETEKAEPTKPQSPKKLNDFKK